MDETQSTPREHISIIRASAKTYSETSSYIFAGTFLTEGNILAQLYQDSCQYEWIVTCPACEKQNNPLGLQHIDVNKPFLFCEHCGEAMDVKTGEWVAQNPENKKVGYRICVLMTPECQWRTDGHDGILCQVGDVDEISQAILSILNDEDKARSFREHGRQTVST